MLSLNFYSDDFLSYLRLLVRSHGRRCQCFERKKYFTGNFIFFPGNSDWEDVLIGKGWSFWCVCIRYFFFLKSEWKRGVLYLWFNFAKKVWNSNLFFMRESTIYLEKPIHTIKFFIKRNFNVYQMWALNWTLTACSLHLQIVLIRLLTRISKHFLSGFYSTPLLSITKITSNI